jgi:hypothetical protein
MLQKQRRETIKNIRETFILTSTKPMFCYFFLWNKKNALARNQILIMIEYIIYTLYYNTNTS